ncbi:unnamed protein product [Miscanthus lutarioriparius]|uniref:Uncharacterized protein n=1 Tax=Miscanthus lutarioriparius TaxID=422564 RepID=A0A811QAD9_9POAL|nr:unnamed protein product [Miscanthus lutarioriparius]
MQEVDLRVDCAAGCGIAEIIPRRGCPAARDGEERGGGSTATAPARGQSGQGNKSVLLQMREVDLRVDYVAGCTTAEVSMPRRRHGMIQGRAGRALGRGLRDLERRTDCGARHGGAREGDRGNHVHPQRRD